MKIEIKIIIKTCFDCKHRSHTGEFTKGGAKHCCDHNDTCRSRGYDCFKRVIPNINQIPSWCPLKNGSRY